MHFEKRAHEILSSFDVIEHVRSMCAACAHCSFSHVYMHVDENQILNPCLPVSVSLG